VIVVVIAGLVLAVGIVVGTMLVLSRRAGTMADPVHDIVHRPLPDAESIDADTLNRIEFDTSLRGYRMAQVDDVVDRMVVALAERDAEIARLRGDEGVRLIADDDDVADGDRADEGGEAEAATLPSSSDDVDSVPAQGHATTTEQLSGDAPTPGMSDEQPPPTSGWGS
jgi:DivIVA domain-containing protein